jgi:homospermidine synthase
MTGAGLLSIILGFIIMILMIANGLLSQGLLLTREQKIKIFLDEYEMMDKHEKTQFINEYYDDKKIKSICNAIIPINTPGY